MNTFSASPSPCPGRPCRGRWRPIVGVGSWAPALLPLLLALPWPQVPAAAMPFPGFGSASEALRSSPWAPANWLSCDASRCSGTLPDGRQVSLERQSPRFSPRQTVSASLAGQSLTSSSERSPITTATLTGPVLGLPVSRSTSGTVFGQPLSLFTTSSGVVSGSYGEQPVLCAADGWGYPGNPSCF